jgi:hypothetical protein
MILRIDDEITTRYKFSILELAPVRDDKSIEFSLRHALELAQHAENLGYERFG